MFIYSEKATKFCEISAVDLSVATQDKLWPSQNILTLSWMTHVHKFIKCSINLSTTHVLNWKFNIGKYIASNENKFFLKKFQKFAYSV